MRNSYRKIVVYKDILIH